MALGEDVELLGNAFEDMQEQNVRLQQQLKEKDDANFKLMSEKIKVCLISFVVNFLVTRVSLKKKKLIFAVFISSYKNPPPVAG